MSARGEYRAVFSVLVDTPDFQALHKDARLLWFTVKMSLSASGIGVLYDDQLVERSGLSHEELRAAREALVAGTWLAVQGRIHWLRNGLKFEPHMSLSNDNHRSFIAKEILGLPKLAVVNLFARYYGLPEPFPGAPGDGLRMVSTCHRDTIPDHTITISPPLPLPEGLPPAARANVENSDSGHEPPAELTTPTPKAAPEPPPARPAKSRPTRLPDDWQPNPGHTELASELRVDLRLETAKFRDWAAANGRTQADWDATFRNWLRNAIRYAGAAVRAAPDFGNETARDQKRTEEARRRANTNAAEERERQEREATADEAEQRAWLERQPDVQRKAIERDAAARVKTMLTVTGGKLREAMTAAALLSAIKDARAGPQAELVGGASA